MGSSVEEGVDQITARKQKYGAKCFACSKCFLAKYGQWCEKHTIEKRLEMF